MFTRILACVFYIKNGRVDANPTRDSKRIVAEPRSRRTLLSRGLALGVRSPHCSPSSPAIISLDYQRSPSRYGSVGNEISLASFVPATPKSHPIQQISPLPLFYQLLIIINRGGRRRGGFLFVYLFFRRVERSDRSLIIFPRSIPIDSVARAWNEEGRNSWHGVYGHIPSRRDLNYNRRIPRHPVQPVRVSLTTRHSYVILC